MGTVAIVTARTILFLLETCFALTAGSMIVLCRWQLATGDRIIVLAAEFEAALPTPGTSTARADYKGATCLKPAGKNIVAGSILQSPALAPGTLFGIGAHDGLVYRVKPNLSTQIWYTVARSTGIKQTD